MIERILFKLIIFHLLILLVVQGFLTSTPFIKNSSKIFLYEGVGADIYKEKLDVFHNQ